MLDEVKKSLKNMLSQENLFRIFILVAFLLLIWIPYWVWTASINSTESIIKWGPYNLNREFRIGDLLTAISLFGSAFAISFGWYFSEQQKRKEYEKEYADRIRSSAVTILAKLERRIELNLCFFDEIQSLLEKTDMYVEKELNFIEASRFLFERLVRTRAEYSKAIADEKIEIDYKDLYGYLPIEENLFETIHKYKYVDRLIDRVLLDLTEADIFHMKTLLQNGEAKIDPFYLGRRLRWTAGMLRYEYYDLICGVIEPFRDTVNDLMNLNDKEIFSRKIKIKRVDDIREDEDKAYLKILKMKGKDKLKRAHARYWAIKGLEYCRQKSYMDSCYCYSRAATLAPDIAGIWAGWGLALRACGLDDQAQKAFDKAVELRPGSPQIPPLPKGFFERAFLRVRKVLRKEAN